MDVGLVFGGLGCPIGNASYFQERPKARTQCM